MIQESIFFQNLTVMILGSLIGSFLNVVIYRLPLDQSILLPRSHCTQCKKSIPWFYNIPVIGYFLSSQKCYSCHSKISFRYPLNEALCAILFYLSYQGLPESAVQFISQARIWFFIAIGIAITWIDLDHRIIPNELSLGGWAIGALTAFADFRHDWVELLIASLAGFGFFFVFAWLYERITGKMGLGGGDIKFMGTIGVFLGLGGVWSSILIASILGSIVGLVYAKINSKPLGQDQTQKTGMKAALKVAIPFGPFLVLGALFELFFEGSRWMMNY